MSQDPYNKVIWILFLQDEDKLSETQKLHNFIRNYDFYKEVLKLK